MTLQEWIKQYGNSYQSSYADAIARVQGELGSTAADYDYESDPLYELYKRQYTGEGRNAALDAYGSAAANAGGYDSSYAVAAAEQARSYYNSKLADKIPELWELAYDSKLSELESLQDSEKQDYERWLDGIEWGYKLWNEEHSQSIQNENLRLRQESSARAEASAAAKAAAAAVKAEEAAAAAEAEAAKTAKKTGGEVKKKETYKELIKPKTVRGLTL